MNFVPHFVETVIKIYQNKAQKNWHTLLDILNQFIIGFRGCLASQRGFFLRLLNQGPPRDSGLL